MRNVLHLVGSFHQGGSERQALQLARLLGASGRYGVRLASLDGDGVLRAEAEALAEGEVPRFALTSFHDAGTVRQLRRFARYLSANDIAIVHTHDFYTNVFGMVGAALARVPARVASKRETSGVRSGAQRIAERAAYRLAHAIVANADAVGRQLVDEGVRDEKIVRIYNGLDSRRVGAERSLDRAASLASLGLPGHVENRFVTIVANMRLPVKDHATFLRAARRVREARPDAAFLLAGEGELVDGLRALARELGVEDRAVFLGRCDRVAELLAVSDVCVLSSRAEGFSNAILEYMAAGRPVVATRVGGAAEAVADGETGYLVDVGDDARLAERIVELLGDPARARAMGDTGRRVVAERFSCEAQLASTERLYDRLLGRRAG